MKRNKPKNNLPPNYSLGNAILDLLLDIGENSILFEDPLKRLWRASRGIPAPKRWRYNRAMAYLARSEEITLTTEKNHVFVELTRKGKLRALMTRLDQDFKKPQTWDGKWRVIMWDIPENSKQQRNRIRALVKDLGFYQLQKSVFVRGFALPASAVQYLRESELLQYIRFIRADKFDNDSALKRNFKL